MRASVWKPHFHYTVSSILWSEWRVDVDDNGALLLTLLQVCLLGRLGCGIGFCISIIFFNIFMGFPRFHGNETYFEFDCEPTLHLLALWTTFRGKLADTHKHLSWNWPPLSTCCSLQPSYNNNNVCTTLLQAKGFLPNSHISKITVHTWYTNIPCQISRVYNMLYITLSIICWLASCI